jgi:hypothetical protein
MFSMLCSWVGYLLLTALLFAVVVVAVGLFSGKEQ